MNHRCAIRWLTLVHRLFNTVESDFIDLEIFSISSQNQKNSDLKPAIQKREGNSYILHREGCMEGGREGNRMMEGGRVSERALITCNCE